MEIINPVPSSGGVELSTIQQLLNDAYSDKNALVCGVLRDSWNTGAGLFSDATNPSGVADLDTNLLNANNTEGAIEIIFRPLIIEESVVFALADRMGGNVTYIEVGFNADGRIHIALMAANIMQWESTSNDVLITTGNVHHVMIVQNGNAVGNPVVYHNGVIVTMTEDVAIASDAWYPEILAAVLVDAAHCLGLSAEAMMIARPFIGEIYRSRVWNYNPDEAVRDGCRIGGVPYNDIGAMTDEHLNSTVGGPAFWAYAGGTPDFATSGTGAKYTWSTDVGAKTMLQNVVGGAEPRSLNGKGLKRYRLTYTISASALDAAWTIVAWQLTTFAGVAVDLEYPENGTYSVDFLSASDADVVDFILSLEVTGGQGTDVFTIDDISLIQIGCVCEFSPNTLFGLYWDDCMHKRGDEVEKCFSFARASGEPIAPSIPTERKRIAPVIYQRFRLLQDSIFTTKDIVPDGYFVDRVIAEEIGTAGAPANCTVTIGGTNIVNAQAVTNGIKNDLALVTPFYASAQEYEEIAITMAAQVNGVYDITIIYKRCS